MTTPVPGIRAVIIDFGRVISFTQPDADVAAILAAAGGDPSDTWDRFWRHRLDYDRGDLDDAGFWSLVTAQDVGPGDRLRRLVELDVDSWSHMRPESLAAIDELAARGLRLALLSNAPKPHADWMLAQPWAARFAAHVFSYAVHTTKPDPTIYEHTLAALGCSADQALFVDDNEENIVGARRLGITAVHFTGPQAWDQVRAIIG